jgi:hypothetical protein
VLLTQRRRGEGITPFTLPLFLRDCVIIGKIVENVMLNLFQHLKKSMLYETLK